VDDPPDFSDRQDLRSEADVLSRLRQARPVGAELVSTPERLVERAVSVTRILGEKVGSPPRVAPLPGLPEAFQPQAEPVMIVTCRQYASKLTGSCSQGAPRFRQYRPSCGVRSPPAPARDSCATVRLLLRRLSGFRRSSGGKPWPLRPR
jgi:hypothetical protein